jgi:UDP-N-acetylglucosamine:LPS N-acetylglucosamine transferase
MRRDDAVTGQQASRPATTVVILTAAIGSGHEAAGRAAQAELQRAGRQALVLDGLRPMSPTLERLLRRGHAGQLAHAPWMWGVLFTVVGWQPVAATVRWLAGALYGRRLARLLGPLEPAAIISTYPLVTAALAHLRRTGRLRVPVVALITDYGVHPLWVAPRADLHLVASPASVALAERAGGRARAVRLPIDERFRAPLGQAAARLRLGIPASAFVTLIVGGAWGVGDLEGAAACALAAGAFTIVVTGSNAALLGRLTARFAAEERLRVVGWTDDMPCLMRAADCVIQNAGGMTCVEAVALGLPIVFYAPLNGHGQLNARVMLAAGAAQAVNEGAELTALLRAASRGEATLARPQLSAAPAFGVALDALPDPLDPLTQPAPDPFTSPARVAAYCALALLVVTSMRLVGVRDAVGDVGHWLRPSHLLASRIALLHLLAAWSAALR